MNDPDERAVCLELNPFQENVRGGNGPDINPQTKDCVGNNKKKKKRSTKRASSASDEVKDRRKDRDKKAKHVQSTDCGLRQLESECMPNAPVRGKDKSKRQKAVVGSSTQNTKHPVCEEKAVDAMDDECNGDDEFKLDAAAAPAEEAAEDEEEEGAFKGKDKTALTADYVVRKLDPETREDKDGSPTTVNWYGVTLSTSPETRI
jgi:hypothetical protein